MSEKLNQILNLVQEYVQEQEDEQKWIAGQDWVQYSGNHYDAEEYVGAVQTLLDGWLVFGKKSRKFENDFVANLGKQHGLLTNSGSSANLLMFSAIASKNGKMEKYHLPRGSKIITPAVCFPTTLNPIIQNGYEPVFVDVELPNANLNLDEVEEKLKEDKDIKAIVFAHVLGNPPDMDRLMKLVDEYDLLFLEDACDALGSYYDGKKLGSYGDISTCSFYPAHHMTMGEGGFVATDSYAVRRVLASLRDWGRACYCNDKKPGDVTCETACGNRFKNWLPGCREAIYDHRYVYDEIGYNLKPIEIQAALGLAQMKKLPAMEQSRRDNFNKLYDIFKPYEQYFWLPKATEKSDPCWFGFLFTVKPGAPFTKQQLVNHLESNKIQTRSYFAGNVLYHPAYQELAQKYDNLRELFPISHEITVNSAFLGTYIGITDEKMQYIKSVIDSFFGEIS